MTDDPGNVPAKYWEKATKEEVKPEPLETLPAQQVQPPAAPEGERRELYGDYPIDWWAERFKGLRRDISDNEQRLATAKQFIVLFEGGRRYGTLFSGEDVTRYEGFKAEIPVIEEKLKKLKDDLDELRRKAVIYGVPRNIRE